MGKFGWGPGYGVLSLSDSGVTEVAKYIANQEEPHRKEEFCQGAQAFWWNAMA